MKKSQDPFALGSVFAFPHCVSILDFGEKSCGTGNNGQNETLHHLWSFISKDYVVYASYDWGSRTRRTHKASLPAVREKRGKKIWIHLRGCHRTSSGRNWERTTSTYGVTYWIGKREGAGVAEKLHARVKEISLPRRTNKRKEYRKRDVTCRLQRHE